MFSQPKLSPPPPPAPPANPPTYASQASALPNLSMGRFGGMSSTIFTGPMGTLDTRTTQRKALLGQ